MRLSANFFSNCWNFIVAVRLPDYIVCLFLCIGGWLIGKKVPPYCRFFSWDDISINNTLTKHETFPSWSLFPISLLPLLVYIFVELIRFFSMEPADPHELDLPRTSAAHAAADSKLHEEMLFERGAEPRDSGLTAYGDEEETRVHVKYPRWRVLFERINHWILAHAFAVGLCMLMVDVTKVFVGRLRPDFLSRLRKKGYTPESHDVNWCNVARKGRLSFPSGHSGISFASIVTLVIFFLFQLRVFRTGSVWRCVIGLLPLVLPFTIAVSRTRDNRHFFSDILGGSLIGAACAIFSVLVIFTLVNRTGEALPRDKYLSLRRRNADPA